VSLSIFKNTTKSMFVKRFGGEDKVGVRVMIGLERKKGKKETQKARRARPRRTSGTLVAVWAR